MKLDKPGTNALRPSAEFRYNRAFCKYRPLFCAAQWDPEVSLVHSVARRSMVAAQQMRSGVSDSRFATRYESRAPTGKIVVDRSVSRAARRGPILVRPWDNLICLLLWECYVRIGGRFLSGPGCLLNSRSNKLEPIDFESLFELEPPLDSFSLPLLRINVSALFSRLAASWKVIGLFLVVKSGGFFSRISFLMETRMGKLYLKLYSCRGKNVWFGLFRLNI